MKTNIPSPQQRQELNLVVLSLLVLSLSFYANLSLLVNDPSQYRFFPPFKEGINAYDNSHLGAEYLCIAQSLVAGEGFSGPYREKSGPTSLMPPALSVVLAALLWLCHSELELVTDIIVLLQNLTLILSGYLVLKWSRHTGHYLGPGIALVFYGIALLSRFRLCFQLTHDWWWLLLLMMAMLCFLVRLWEEIPSRATATGWGVFGGICALSSPVLGFVWGCQSLAFLACKPRRWVCPVALGVAFLVISPWVVRNYLVFGKLIPIKSGLFFELYQSQVLEPTGVFHFENRYHHPYLRPNAAREAYKNLGEVAYLQVYKQKFLAAVNEDPLSYVTKTANRFLAITLFHFRTELYHQGPLLWVVRVVHPLPFCSFVLLLLFRRPLHLLQKIFMSTYLLFMLPYVLISYVERYTMPLLGIQVMLCFWGAEMLIEKWKVWGPKCWPVRKRKGEKSPITMSVIVNHDLQGNSD
jgi:hypothetical protein